MFKKIKERLSKLKLLDYVLIILIILLSIVFAVIALKDEKPNENNKVNASDLSITNLSTYQENHIVNLASPNLAGKEYLGNGVYDFTLYGEENYNVISGEIFRSGISGQRFETINYPNLIGTYTIKVSDYKVNGLVTRPLFVLRDKNYGVYIGEANANNFTRTLNLTNGFSMTFQSGNVQSMSFKLQIEQGTTATPYQTPIGALEQHIQLEKDKSYWEGYDVGFGVGRDTGINEGYDNGYDWGFYSGFNEGFDEGHDKGYIMGANDGLDSAYDKGFDEGERVGELEGFQEAKELYGYYSDGVYYTGRQAYNLGSENSPSNNFGSLITSILLGVGTVLGIELLPNITIGAIIAVPIVFGIIAFVLGRKKE